MRVAATNGELLDGFHSLVVGLAVERLHRLVHADLEKLKSLGPAELVDAGYCDPIRVFVKNELHSSEKVAAGRFRLIASVSVVDQIVERVLNARQNNTEIERWETLWSKPGMGLHDEGLSSLGQQMAALHRNGRAPMSSDISGFDWSVDQWALDLDARVRAELTGIPHNLHEKRALCLGFSLIVFSDGVMWQQTIRGIQKSGSYLTSSTNSRIRAALARLVGRRCALACGQEQDGGGVIAMGDDAVETHPLVPEGNRSNFVQLQYQRLGYELKAWSHDLEFCAYAFLCPGMDAWEPVRWHKMLASFLATAWATEDSRDQVFGALEYELRHSPHRARALALVRASGWWERK